MPNSMICRTAPAEYLSKESLMTSASRAENSHEGKQQPRTVGPEGRTVQQLRVNQIVLVHRLVLEGMSAAYQKGPETP